jgi:hypothetical protein
VRINIDVRNAQTALFDTKAKLAKARYDVACWLHCHRGIQQILSDTQSRPQYSRFRTWNLVLAAVTGAPFDLCLIGQRYK